MPTPKYVQARDTTVHVSFSGSETAEITLKELVDIYGNALAMSDFGSILVLTFNPGNSDNEEIISTTGFTVNSDGTVTLDTSITRMLLAKSPYSASGATAYDHAAGEKVVVSNNPQLYDAIIDYIDGIALAGAPDASMTGKGIVEIATTAEIDAGTATGSTGAIIAVAPDKLATSIYGTRLPSTAGKQYVDAATGMISLYGGASAPTGFLLCDGTAYSIATYNALALVIRNYYGNNAGATFTADAGTDFITATSHGLSDGDHIFLTNVGGALPAGLSVNTSYYVRDKTTNTFKVTASVGGAAVDITGAGTGTHSFHTQFKVPDLRGSMPLGQGTRVRTITFDGAAYVDPATDTITVASNDWLHTGQAVALTGSSLPTGLSATTYYVIRTSATAIQLATSRANADDGTAVDITADGSGTCTLTQTLTARTIGTTGGEEDHTLQTEELASHKHQIDTQSDSSPDNYYGFNYVGGSSNGAYTGDASEVVGSDTPHNVMNPYTVVAYIIKT